jgi:prevent-host-death family protein
MGAGEVSVRELRQNLSVYLRRVKEGTTLAVTSRGERVAVLASIEAGTAFDRLIAEGRVSAPPQPWSVPEPVAAGGDVGPTLTDALLAMRDEDAR